MQGPMTAACLLSTFAVMAATPAAAAPWTLHEALGAPADLTLSGSVRLRYEAIGGQARAGVGRGEDMTLLRTIVTAEYRTGPFRIGGEIYDSRAYGADRGGVLSNNDVDALEPVQAYVAADLGHPSGTIKTWANRLGLTDPARAAATQFKAKDSE